jgi:hypothetical protein
MRPDVGNKKAVLFITGRANPMSKTESESARKIARREVLYKATSKKLTEYITGGIGLERERGEPLKQYKQREFEFACEVLNTEIDSLENIQAAFLRGKYCPTIVLDREYALVMVMRAFADYLRFKPTE